MGFRRRWLVPLSVVLLMIGAMACDPDGQSVTGKVVSVESRSLTEFESLTIVDDDGRPWIFTGGEFSGFTPSHLQEHIALGDPVKVWFVEEEDGTLRVTRIEDG